MRRFVGLLLSGLIVAGCSSHPARHASGDADAPTNAPPKKAREKLIITPETTLLGKIVRVNNSTRFVVVNFPVGSLPGIGQQMGVYRQGMKVGEIRITGPQQDDNTVADILSGEAQIGDQTRAN